MSDDVYRKVLRACYVRLLEDMEPIALLDKIVEKDFFPHITTRDIKEMKSTTEKNRKIVDRVMSKGSQGFQDFLKMLDNSDNEHVAAMLRKKERELQPGKAQQKQTESSKKPQPKAVQPRPLSARGPISQPPKHDVVPSNSPPVEDLSRMSLSTNQNQSVGSVNDELARERFFKKFIQTMEESKFEGRILDIDESLCKNAIRNQSHFDGGGYGKVYLVKHEKNTDMSMVIKRIQCKNDDDKLHSATCEMLAAGLMHFAIVPLWARAKDKDATTFYFILPYLENRSLAERLQEDKYVIDRHQPEKPWNAEKELTLCKEDRLRILYQVACALAFLHKEIPNSRRSLVHRDVTSRNIVLDSKFNARLLDFGLAREYAPGKDGVTMKTSDLIGVPGYFRTNMPKTLTVEKDVFNFGIVILEVLSSYPPCWGDRNDIELKKKLADKHFTEDLQTHIQFVWGANKDSVKKLMQIATQCQEETITSACVRKQLEKHIRVNGWEHWKDPQAERQQKRCVICLINPVDEDAEAILDHQDGRCNLHVCAACMRNSYLNPIQCHSCDKTVQPTIGHQWEAILVAGNDVVKKKSAETFKKDVDKVFKAITSRHPMTMGISKESVHRVCADKPGTSQELLPDLKKKFIHVAKQKIHSLLFYFTGHHGPEKGFKLGDNDEHLTSKELEEYIEDAVKKAGCKRVLVLLDCCKAPVIKQELSDSYYRINSCNEAQETKFLEGEGSLMTEFFVQSLKGKSSKDQCLLQKKLTQKNLNQEQNCGICTKFKSENGFMKIDILHENVEKHVQAYDKLLRNIKHDITPHFRGNSWKDAVFAYFIDSPVTFEFTLQHPDPSKTTHVVVVNQLPEREEELKQELFIAYREKFQLPKLKLEDFTDMLAIMYLTGPLHSNKHELDTLGMIEVAWNAKRDLCVGLREIQNLHIGKVGVVGDGVRAVLECLDNELCERSQQDSTVIVKCSLEGDGARKLLKYAKADLKQLLEKIRDDDKIEKKGKLVFTFPEKDEDGNQITNFYSIHVEK